MKVTIKEDYSLQLEEVFNSLTLVTEKGEEVTICMRDSGFEFKYNGSWYFAKNGEVKQFEETKSKHLKDRGNKAF